LNVFHIGCERCGRAGSYRRGGLVKRFGGGIALPDLLVAIIAIAAVLATTATANAIHLRCDAPIVSFGPSDPGKDPVKTVDIERDGPNGQWAILYYTESGNIINRRSQYYIETVAYGATSYWRGVLKINSAIVDQGVIWVDSTTGVYTYQETIRKNGEIIVDMTARGCVRLDQPDVAAPAQTPAVHIGDKTLENVVGGIASVAGSLLLGQSFLSRFKSWSIDNQRRALILN
jgi:hypothetical protein